MSDPELPPQDLGTYPIVIDAESILKSEIQRRAAREHRHNTAVALGNNLLKVLTVIGMGMSSLPMPVVRTYRHGLHDS